MFSARRTKAHSVFVPEIDREHAALCEVVDELRFAIEGNKPLSEALEILNRLIVLAEDHFSHEETLMRSFRYPTLEWHRQQHETVRKRVRQFLPEIQSGKRESAVLLIDFIKGWIKDHTGVTDRMMGAYIRNMQRYHAA